VVPGFLQGCFSRFFSAPFGAIVAEVLKRWQQWSDMPEKRFLALSKTIEFWAITVFLILLSGSVGVFEGTKTHPIDWSLCFFVGVGAISTVRNFLSGVVAHGGPRAKRRRLKRQLSRSRVPDGGLSGKGQIAKLEQEGDTRYVHKAALETLGRLQEPVLEETQRALQKAIRLNLQNAEAHYNLGVLLKERGRFEEAERAFQEAIRLNPQDTLGSNSVAGLLQEPWGREKLRSLSEKADTNVRTPIGWRDIFN
jgi:tetratricopeptide (TPR) repeat protein